MREREKKVKSIIRIAALILTMLFIIAEQAMGEVTSWTCLECGKTGNTGNFCGNCGKRHSVENYSMVVTSNSGKEKNVLVDADGIIVILQGEPKLESDNLVMNILVENTSDRTAGANSEDIYLNGWKVSNYGLSTGELRAGTKAKGTITLRNVSAEASIEEIEDLEKIELFLYTYYTVDYRIHELTKGITVTIDMRGKNVQ